MNQTLLYTLPVPSSEFYMDAFHYNNCILYDYKREDGKNIRTGIRFNSTTAFREQREESCKTWHIENYDTLVEIQNSLWADEFLKNLSALYSDWIVRHFKIFVHSNCFEVIAASWDILPEYEGLWKEIFPDVKLFIKPLK